MRDMTIYWPKISVFPDVFTHPASFKALVRGSLRTQDMEVDIDKLESLGYPTMKTAWSYRHLPSQSIPRILWRMDRQTEWRHRILPKSRSYSVAEHDNKTNVMPEIINYYYLPPTTEEVYVFARMPAFVCLSVCLCARLLKNACMDLDEMLRVDRCRDMDELINFWARSGS